MTDQSGGHTPGPWVVNPFTARIDVPGRDAPICALLWPTDLRSEDETFANGRLIASAPDLLAALEWMVANDDTNEGDEPLEQLRGQSWNEVNAYWIEGLNRARAAITLATPDAAASEVDDPDHQYAVVSSNYSRPFLVGAYPTLDAALLAQDGEPDRWHIYRRLPAAPDAAASEAGEAGEDMDSFRDLERAPLAALHRLQHTGSPAAKPKLGGSILQWAADEIAALRAAVGAGQ